MGRAVLNSSEAHEHNKKWMNTGIGIHVGIGIGIHVGIGNFSYI